jgi:phospholipid/cholesterol/gamma-HCH transport system permease protein
MPGPAHSIERSGRTAVVRVHGDVIVPTSRHLYGTLRNLCRRRDVKKIVLDFGDVGRLDSSGVAVIELVKRTMHRSGKELELDHLENHHEAAFELAPPRKPAVADQEEEPTWLERVGDRVLGVGTTLRGLGGLVRETGVQGWHVLTRRRRLPAGSFTEHVLAMGADAVFIVGLLSFLLGMTVAFQGAVQLQKFGAGVFVADMVGWSMVREFSPLITAIVLTGRTGAAIAAELGTMRVGSEIDALSTMGVSPIRFLIVPRMLALTFVQPALTLMSMFIGIAGGFVVAAMTIDLSPSVFWGHISERVRIGDFAQGIGKSFVFAQIIGLTACHLGLRASGDANSVGRATTRTVVVSIFMIVVVDALFATIITIARSS